MTQHANGQPGTASSARPQIRLLPWCGLGGKPAYLVTDDHAHSRLSRLADSMEAVQLGMGTELLGHAEALLGEPKADASELRFLSARLVEALRDALRVADSRGARLPVPETTDEARTHPEHPRTPPHMT
ncbi:hypothetical protein QIS99_18980 [Streptomyces sp. B-S-A8]|uniref:Uncharacterized protein n=1 Tax=Streptomyces solicavernae TaxID=3043614 RepID=A0ABT6RUZ8_9ACTN|nr:hypothetical protein [Streptomyces sp. B-S-A8]MDI3388272.1 hypothetical protein [Streptomyces sp. B-S-A8]